MNTWAERDDKEQDGKRECRLPIHHYYSGKLTARDGIVASRPRFGCYSPALSRFSYTEAAEQGGLRQRGSPNVYIDVLSLR